MNIYFFIPAEFEYVIVGAGPAGLQAAYFLEKSKRSYVVMRKDPWQATSLSETHAIDNSSPSIKGNHYVYHSFIV